MNRCLTLASSLSVLLMIASGAAQAKPLVEAWRTPINCGGQQFEVISRCKAGPKTTELNVCEPGQQLVTGDQSVRVPTSRPAKGQPVLFAVLWSCLETPQGPVLVLDYTSGQGRSEGDEDAELFDAKLQVIKDTATQRKLYKLMPQATKGSVKSIMPFEGN